jgi:hypothetical protein
MNKVTKKEEEIHQFQDKLKSEKEELTQTDWGSNVFQIQSQSSVS